MKVSSTNISTQARRADTSVVLVVLLHLVLPHNDCHEDFHRLFPPPHHGPPYRHLDHLQRHGRHCYHRRRLLLCHHVPMQAHLFLLEQGSRRVLPQHGCHHCPYLSVQRVQRYLRLHLCFPPDGDHLGTEHQQKEQDGPSANHGYGLRVSSIFYPIDQVTDEENNSASAAVVVRFPYVKNFKNPDFLCKLPQPLRSKPTSLTHTCADATVDIAIWSCTEQGLAITAGSLATLRPLLRNVGYCFGLSTPGPTELHDSDHQALSGTMGGQSSRKKSQQDPFSLTRLDREDDGPFDAEDGRQVFGNRQGDRRIAPWESQGSSQDGSEEGFAGNRSSTFGQDWKGHNIVKVQTVTVTSERS